MNSRNRTRIVLTLAAVVIAILGLTAPALHAAALTWDTDPSDGANITAGSGNWNITAGNIVWNDGAGNVIWSQTSTTLPLNSATFVGADGTVDSYVVTLGATQMAASALTFDSSGYKITGGTVYLPVPTPNTTSTITVADGKTATINSAIRYANNVAMHTTVGLGGTLNLGGGYFSGSNYQPRWKGAGTINVTAGTYVSNTTILNTAQMNQSGGAVSSTYQIWINNNAGQKVNYTISGGTMSLNHNNSSRDTRLVLGVACGDYTSTLTVKTGGTVNVGTTAGNSGYLAIVGDGDNGCGLLDVQGGALTVGTGNAANKLYFFEDGARAGKTATMTQSGGTVTAQGIQFGSTSYSSTHNPTASATLQLTGGYLYIGSLGITRGAAAADLPVTIQLSGGTLGASADWSSSLDMKLGTSGGGVTVQAADSGGVARDIGLSGILSDDGAVNGGLTKTGAGALTLSGANTYSGATLVSDGTLQIGDGGTTGSIDNTSAVTNNAALVFNRGDPVNVGYIISGSGTVTQQGSGTLTLTNVNNNYTGLTAVNAGTLVLDYTTNSSKLSDTAALVLGGGTLDLKGGTHTEVVASTTLAAGTASGVTSSTPGSTLQMNAITRGAGASINFGASGIATTDNPNVNGILGPWATVAGTDLAMNSTGGDDGPITACTGYTNVTRLDSGPQVIANDSTTNVRIVEGAGSLASITLGAAPTTIYTLNQSASGGEAVIDPAGLALLTNTILVGAGAGGLTIGTGTNNGTLSAATAGGDLLLINNTANGLTVNSVIADNSTSTLTKVGAGTAMLVGDNTYAGGTNLAGGTLQLGHAGALGTGVLTFSGGNLDSSVADLVNANVNLQAWNADFTFVGSQNLDLGTGGVTLSANCQVTVSANTLTVGGVIGGAFGLTKAGAGTLVLAGANTYTGATIVREGVLELGSTGKLNNGSYAGAIAIADTATFKVSRAGGTGLQTLSGPITGAGTLIQNGNADLSLSNAGNTFSTLIVGSNGGRVFINSNAGALPAGATTTIGNQGILDFGAGTTYSGTITVQSGGGIATRVSAGTTLSNVTLPGSGTAILNNDDQTTYLLTISSGQTISTGGTLTVQVGGGRVGANPIGAVTLSGGISGPGSLAKTGNGELILSGNNAYTGDTTISAGVLTIVQPYLDDAAAVTISITGGLNLAFTDSSVIDLVGDLWLGAIHATPGTTYNSVSGLGYITGTGNIKVAGVMGDTDRNGVVDAADFITLKRNFGAGVGGGAAVGNFDKTGTVDWNDLGILMTNMGAGSTAPATTPEPATLGLLAIGALAMLRKNRRS